MKTVFAVFDDNIQQEPRSASGGRAAIHDITNLRQKNTVNKTSLDKNNSYSRIHLPTRSGESLSNALSVDLQLSSREETNSRHVIKEEGNCLLPDAQWLGSLFSSQSSLRSSSSSQLDSVAESILDPSSKYLPISTDQRTAEYGEMGRLQLEEGESAWWECDYCGLAFANLDDATLHESACTLNPASRTRGVNGVITTSPFAPGILSPVMEVPSRENTASPSQGRPSKDAGSQKVSGVSAGGATAAGGREVEVSTPPIQLFSSTQIMKGTSPPPPAAGSDGLDDGPSSESLGDADADSMCEAITRLVGARGLSRISDRSPAAAGKPPSRASAVSPPDRRQRIQIESLQYSPSSRAGPAGGEDPMPGASNEKERQAPAGDSDDGDGVTLTATVGFVSHVTGDFTRVMSPRVASFAPSALLLQAPTSADAARSQGRPLPPPAPHPRSPVHGSAAIAAEPQPSGGTVADADAAIVGAGAGAARRPLVVPGSPEADARDGTVRLRGVSLFSEREAPEWAAVPSPVRGTPAAAATAAAATAAAAVVKIQAEEGGRMPPRAAQMRAAADELHQRLSAGAGLEEVTSLAQRLHALTASPAGTAGAGGIVDTKSPPRDSRAEPPSRLGSGCGGGGAVLSEELGQHARRLEIELGRQLASLAAERTRHAAEMDGLRGVLAAAERGAEDARRRAAAAAEAEAAAVGAAEDVRGGAAAVEEAARGLAERHREEMRGLHAALARTAAALAAVEGRLEAEAAQRREAEERLRRGLASAAAAEKRLAEREAAAEALATRARRLEADVAASAAGMEEERRRLDAALCGLEGAVGGVEGAFTAGARALTELRALPPRCPSPSAGPARNRDVIAVGGAVDPARARLACISGGPRADARPPPASPRRAAVTSAPPPAMPPRGSGFQSPAAGRGITSPTGDMPRPGAAARLAGSWSSGGSRASSPRYSSPTAAAAAASPAVSGPAGSRGRSSSPWRDPTPAAGAGATPVGGTAVWREVMVHAPAAAGLAEGWAGGGAWQGSMCVPPPLQLPVGAAQDYRAQRMVPAPAWGGQRMQPVTYVPPPPAASWMAPPAVSWRTGGGAWWPLEGSDNLWTVHLDPDHGGARGAGAGGADFPGGRAHGGGGGVWPQEARGNMFGGGRVLTAGRGDAPCYWL